MLLAKPKFGFFSTARANFTPTIREAAANAASRISYNNRENADIFGTAIGGC